MFDADARDSATLKLTVDGKRVIWESAGSRLPHPTGKNIQSYLDSHSFHDDEDIRVVGTAANAELLVELYNRRTRKEFDALEVCSPLCCLDPIDRDKPDIMLYNMRKFNRAPSLGGWHEFTLRDFPAYLLAMYFYDPGAASVALDFKPDYPDEVLFHHCVWPHLSFIENLGMTACAELIGTIIDPRWYIDETTEGDNGARLEQFLGLYAGISKEAETTRSKRFRLLISCWKNSGGNILQADGPRGFVWRTWAAKGGGEKGDIAACKCFLTFLRLTWTMQLCQGGQANRLFVPEYFFTNKDEQEAYHEHMRQFDPQPEPE